MSPLTFLWLEGLESSLPGASEPNPAPKSKEKTGNQESKLNVGNTVAKIVIDQTLGGAWITVLFIATMGTLRGLDYEAIVEQIQSVSAFPVLYTAVRC
jgi:protein Mpv17